MTLKYKVTNQTLNRLDDNIVVEKSVNYLTIKFIFSDEWLPLDKSVKFKDILTNTEQEELLDENSSVAIPSEFASFPGFVFTLIGEKDGTKITTETKFVDIIRTLR